MPLSNRDRLPHGAVRDLLSLDASALPRRSRERREPGTPADARQIGHALREALELSKAEPDTIGHRAAWSWAQKGTSALVDYVAQADAPELAAVLHTSAERLRTGS